MKKILYIVLALSTIMMSFNLEKSKKEILLVLSGPMGQERFSIFHVKEVNNILVGENVEDYQVEGGIYRIEGASNDKFYHKRIVILNQ